MDKNILKPIENSNINLKLDENDIFKKTTPNEANVDDSKCENFSFSETPSLEEIRKKAELFCKERNWEQFHTPRNLLLALVGEVGELSEIFQWKGEVPIGLDSKWTQKEREHLEQELSDVFIYLIRLSQVCNVDLPRAVASKMQLNDTKYPVSKFFGLSKKYND